MKLTHRMMLVLLAVCMLLGGCGAAPAEPAEQTVPETTAPAETAAPTEAPTEPVEPLSVAQLPDKDVATGTLCFYFGDKTVYAGGLVSDILDVGIHTYTDLEQLIQPGHLSEAVRVRIEDEAVPEEDRPYLFFVAVNPTEQPRKLSECSIYSLTVNTAEGIAFGSGRESEHFYTGQTTMEELTEAYGEPDYYQSRKRAFAEMAYYEPFNGAYFSFKNGKVRQIFTHYGAELYTSQAEAFDHDLTGYFGNDCYILMNQYLDIAPYILKQDPDSKVPTYYMELTDGTGVPKSLPETIKLGEDTLQLGVEVAQMPETFANELKGLLISLRKHAYMTVGRNNPEEFWLINEGGNYSKYSDDLVVRGVITKNCNYVNWGANQSLYHTFEYDGLTQDSTIEQILEKYGAPKRIDATSTARKCFAWLYYEDEAGNDVHFCVDPMVNQIIEINVIKYFAGEHHT